MLSHNDVHYLVGLFQLVTHPKDVEVELGSMILDTAAEKERDVDVTVTYREGDVVTSLAGFEVKDEGRKLDLIHVEQLWAKLADMPSVTKKGIVSASGYSEPAIKKAKAHGVELYSFEDWDTKENDFPVDFQGFTSFGYREISWIECKFTFSEGGVRLDDLTDVAPVLEPEGMPSTLAPTVKDLCRLIAQGWLNQVKSDPGIAAVAAGVPIRTRFPVEITDPHLAELPSGRYALKSAVGELAPVWWTPQKHQSVRGVVYEKEEKRVHNGVQSRGGSAV